MMGIYAYFDKKDNTVAYVGKDSNIDKNRRKRAHGYSSNYDCQPFNKILQNNPNRYTYQVLVWNVTDKNTLNALEIENIQHLKPKFNYTKGGDGGWGMIPWNKGKTLSDDHRQKLSENHWNCKKENNPAWKDYPRIVKRGKQSNKAKTQRYAIVWKGKTMKRSVDKDYLIEWFELNYPNEKLEV